jgi:hypothetical protein
MLYAAIKALLSGVIIATASEVAKRSPALGAVILSLPLTSILAFIWLWRDTSNKEGIAALSQSHVLVRAAVAPNAPHPAGAAPRWREFLDGLQAVVLGHAVALRRDGVDPRQVRDFALRAQNSR